MDIRLVMWTDSLKALRNNIFRLQSNKTIHLKLRDVDFGWKEILLIADREDKRFKELNLQQSDVTGVTVVLDCFTMMNATYAKQPFTEKTICEVVAHLSKIIGVTVDRHCNTRSEWEQYMHYLHQLKNKGYMGLQWHIKQQLVMLEYQIAVYGIFIERLLNGNWRLTRDNI